jgi:translocator protein
MGRPAKLFFSLLIPQLAGLIGAFFSVSSIESWYNTLDKPSFNPPPYVFGPVWTILYLILGIVLYMIWSSDSPLKTYALKLFAVQMVLNTLWSPVFFGLQSPLLALFIIIPLWVSILMCIKVFYSMRKITGLLLIPYLLWVSFATALNAAIWMLN